MPIKEFFLKSLEFLRQFAVKIYLFFFKLLFYCYTVHSWYTYLNAESKETVEYIFFIHTLYWIVNIVVKSIEKRLGHAFTIYYFV